MFPDVVGRLDEAAEYDGPEAFRQKSTDTNDEDEPELLIRIGARGFLITLRDGGHRRRLSYRGDINCGAS